MCFFKLEPLYLFSGVITLLGLPDNEAQFAKEHDKKRVYLTACDILTITLIVMLCILATPKQMNSFWKICKNFNEVSSILSYNK